MLRALFEKTGNAIYISHLDLMRVFQRAFQRAGLRLTHTQGFNPRPSVSIALPMSLGTESVCELLDFDLEGERLPNAELCRRLNEALVEGVRIREIYEGGGKVKNLALMDCCLTLEYDRGIPEGAQEQIAALFARPTVTVEKKGKNGITEQDIIPMLRRVALHRENRQELILECRVCCQNPTLNPMQLSAAIEKYLPQWKPDFVRCRREDVYDPQENVFR